MSGVPVLYSGNNAPNETSISIDGLGGVFTVWTEPLESFSVLRAMRIGPDGTLQWPSAAAVSNSPVRPIGMATCTSPGGGVLVAWDDFRSDLGASDWDIYVQSMDTSGNSEWGQDGIPVCVEGSQQSTPLVVPTVEGRAIVVWNDDRVNDRYIYAFLAHPDLHFPELSPVEDDIIDVGDTVVIQLSAFDPDPGDTIRYSTDAASVLPSEFEFSPETGLFVWISESGNAGDYDVAFRASDGLYADDDTVTITVFEDSNRPPSIANIDDNYVYAGGLLVFSVSATDPDGDLLAFSIDDLRFSVSDSTFAWQTEEGDTGTWHFTITATDGTMEDTAGVNIHVLYYDPEEMPHDMMLGNIHPFFDWSEQQDIVWSIDDRGFMTTAGSGLYTGIVSRRALSMDYSIEAVFRFRRFSGVLTAFGFTAVPR
jgi:hypothetical protein